MRFLTALLLVGLAAGDDGPALYKQHCAACHDGGVGRAPRPDALKLMSPESVQTALTTGMMTIQGILLTSAEIRSVAQFVTAKQFGGEALPQQAFCRETKALPADPLAGPHWNGWGVDSANRRSQSAAMAGLSAADVPKLKLSWAFGIPGTLRAYGQPTVAGGRVFIGTGARRVYALDAATGCVYWSFTTESGVRGAIGLGRAGSRWAAYFGDQSGEAYAVDAASGELIWKTRVESYPGALITGTPAFYDGHLYVPVSSGEEVMGADPGYECCRFRGSLTSLDASTGKVIWKSYTIPDEPRKTRVGKSGLQQWGPSGVGIWSSPTIDAKRHVIYVATGDSYSDPAARTSDAFLAFDIPTGRLLWSRQMTQGDAFNGACGRGGDNCPEVKGPDFDFGSSPVLVDLPNGKRALIAGQKSGVVHAVDPDEQGEVLWQTRIGKGGVAGGVVWGSAADDRNVYVALSDVRNVRGAGRAAGNKTIFSSYGLFDPITGGGMFALNLSTGEQVWKTSPPPCGDRKGCSPGQSAAVTLIPGVVFSGDLGGRLHAYSTKDGAILWEVETAHDFDTVDGVKANGGAMDGPGPVVAGGRLYVNSGYGFNGGMPGNVLLAFSVDGK